MSIPKLSLFLEFFLMHLLPSGITRLSAADVVLWGDRKKDSPYTSIVLIIFSGPLESFDSSSVILKIEY